METTLTAEELERRYLAALRSIPGTSGPTSRVRELGKQLFAAHIAEFFAQHPEVEFFDVHAEVGDAEIHLVQMSDGQSFVMPVEKGARDDDSGEALDGWDEQRKTLTEWLDKVKIGRFVMAMGDRESRMNLRVRPDSLETIRARPKKVVAPKP